MVHTDVDVTRIAALHPAAQAVEQNPFARPFVERRRFDALFGVAVAVNTSALVALRKKPVLRVAYLVTMTGAECLMVYDHMRPSRKARWAQGMPRQVNVRLVTITF